MMDPAVASLIIPVVATGAFAGIVAGLLGVGGGLIYVPALLLVFRAQGVDGDVAMHAAVGTSLAAIVLASTSSLRSHAKRGNVEWTALRALLPGLLVGALLGAVVAGALDGTTLRRVFGAFLLLVSAQMAGLWQASPHRTLPGRSGMTGAGIGIGTVAALVGIGGGALTAPFLVWCNRPALRAVGTAAAAGLPIAAAGAAGFVAVGWGSHGLPPGSTGFVAWPAALALGGVAMITAPVGVLLAHRLPALALRRVFAVLLIAVGVRMLWH